MNTIIKECKSIISKLREDGRTIESIALDVGVSNPIITKLLYDDDYSFEHARPSTIEKIKAFHKKYRPENNDKVTDFELDEAVDKAKEIDPFKEKTNDDRFWGLLPSLAKLVPEGIELILRVKKP